MRMKNIKRIFPVYLAEVGANGSFWFGARSRLFKSLSAKGAAGLVAHFPIIQLKVEFFKTCEKVYKHWLEDIRRISKVAEINAEINAFQPFQCGQSGKCTTRNQSRIFGRTLQRNGAFPGSWGRPWGRGRGQQSYLKKYFPLYRANETDRIFSKWYSTIQIMIRPVQYFQNEMWKRAR